VRLDGVIQPLRDASFDLSDIDAQEQDLRGAVLAGTDQFRRESERSGQRRADALDQLHRNRDRENDSRRNRPTLSLSLRTEAVESVRGDQAVEPSAVDVERVCDNGGTVGSQNNPRRPT
jgi:hypothetical protein